MPAKFGLSDLAASVHSPQKHYYKVGWFNRWWLSTLGPRSASCATDLYQV